VTARRNIVACQAFARELMQQNNKKKPLSLESKRAIDFACWALVARWVASHSIFTSKKIVLVLILNESSAKVCDRVTPQLAL
jgi:hypothetical protein